MDSYSETFRNKKLFSGNLKCFATWRHNFLFMDMGTDICYLGPNNLQMKIKHYFFFFFFNKKQNHKAFLIIILN